MKSEEGERWATPALAVGGTYRAQRHALTQMAPTPSTRAHHTLGGVVSHVLRGERACSQLKTGADEGRDALSSAGFHVNRGKRFSMSVAEIVGIMGAIFEALIAFVHSCCGEIYRRRRRPHVTVLMLLTICVLIAWLSVQTAAEVVSTGSPTPPHLEESAMLPPSTPESRPSATSRHGTHSRVAVTIRSLHTGKYWQLQKEADGTRMRLSASAPPEQRGLESTVFLLEREGDPESGGWVLLRWLKTRQLLEAVPPGVLGREEDAWSVRLSEAPAVNELHKLIIEDDATHAQSHIWSVGLHGYLNQLASSDEVVGHGDALPPTAATAPPPRGAVAVERLTSGAAWLMEALEQRDKQLDALQEQLDVARAELTAILSKVSGTPCRVLPLMASNELRHLL